MKQLIAWKKNKDRMPLILQGARQVGKTWLLLEFGKTCYSKTFYFNFEETPALIKIFEDSLHADMLLEQLSLFYGEQIAQPDSLIILDEIQAATRVLTSLKYFTEQRPELHIVTAGSLLGVSVGKEGGFPVGKVNFLTLYTLSFSEFILAEGENLLYTYLNKIDPVKKVSSPVHEKLLTLYKKYLYIGGLPAVVQSWISEKNPKQVRMIQREIITAYEKDFSKYTSSSDAIKVGEVWKTIPAILAKEKKKYQYKQVTPKARSSTYRTVIEWLEKSGLIHLAYALKTPQLPLSGYEDASKFKIYFHDIGLLSAMLDIEPKTILDKETLFNIYNGAFVENFVACELLRAGERSLHYWTSKSDAEIDFITHNKGNIIPLEVKSGYSKRKKSLHVYDEKYHPAYLVRLSPREFMKDARFVNIPLYETATFAYRLSD